MKVSIVTVAFNAADSISHTIESVLAQDHPHKEHIVLDGASTDGTQDVVARYAGEGVRLLSEPDCGMYDALNKGLRLFTGDAFGALNADDAFHDRTALSRIAETLARADIAHGDLDFVTDHEARRVVRRWRARERPSSGFRTGWMPAHPTFYVRRRVAEAVGDFDLTLRTAADYDWMLRAVEVHGFSVRKAPGVLVDMMQGGKSTESLSSYVRHNLESLSARRRWLNAGLVDAALVAKPARKIGQFIGR
jgi:glycosyltransferase involved in cell wall biosynthesis